MLKESFGKSDYNIFIVTLSRPFLTETTAKNTTSYSFRTPIRRSPTVRPLPTISILRSHGNAVIYNIRNLDTGGFMLLRVFNGRT